VAGNRKNPAESVPLGTGMADEAKKHLMSRNKKIEAALAAAMGKPNKKKKKAKKKDKKDKMK
tara:strand:+ start:13723 stop:13908 length:186 start_codon:yes stop_codon:yes gene_type:complete